MATIKVMKYGMEGKEVAEAQKALQKAGSTIKVNGKYTIGMTTAVKAFQKKNKLAVTGVIDAKTMAKLMAYAKPAPAKKAPAKKAVEKKPVAKKPAAKKAPAKK